MAEDHPELKQITCIHDLHNLKKKNPVLKVVFGLCTRWADNFAPDN